MSNKQEVKLTEHTLAIDKLAKVHLKLSQNIGFIKYFSNDSHEELEYLNELEQEIRESLELLGYSIQDLVLVTGLIPRSSEGVSRNE